MKIIDYFNSNSLLTIETVHLLLRLGVLILIGIPLVLIMSKWARQYFTKKYSSQSGMIFGKLISYTGIVVILFSILNEFGFKLTHLLGAAGIIGIAVGFASQTSVSNIISGLFLITEKSFQVDDIITVQGITGVVLSIDVLSVKLRTFDNKMVRIPNETIIKSDVTNVTRFPIRRVDIIVGVAYKEEIAKVRQILLEIAEHNPLCLNEPEPTVVFSDFGSSSLDLKLLIWVEKSQWMTLKNRIMEEIKIAFDREGIEIPFPHLSLYTGSETKPVPVRIAGQDQTEGADNKS